MKKRFVNSAALVSILLFSSIIRANLFYSKSICFSKIATFLFYREWNKVATLLDKDTPPSESDDTICIQAIFQAADSVRYFIIYNILIAAKKACLPYCKVVVLLEDLEPALAASDPFLLMFAFLPVIQRLQAGKYCNELDSLNLYKDLYSIICPGLGLNHWSWPMLERYFAQVKGFQLPVRAMPQPVKTTKYRAKIAKYLFFIGCGLFLYQLYKTITPLCWINFFLRF